MAITLVVNPGSASKKYALYNETKVLFSMRFEETGDGFGVCRKKNDEQQLCESIEASDYTDSISQFLEAAISEGVIHTYEDIERVGIRVVAPGSFFTIHQPIDAAYIQQLQSFSSLLPLHTPVLLNEIAAVTDIITHVPVCGISDSAFHTSIPTYRRTLAIAKEDREDFDIARFGYHGLSAASIARNTESFFGIAPDRVVIVHVGGGVSVTALHYQESVDTSMGYSPMSGVLMGSRVGGFDADALLMLLSKKGSKNGAQLASYLNTECGFRGMTGYADLRLVLNAYTEGNSDAARAMEMFRYQIHRQIGGHVALLGGLDALVFTGTAVVRNPFLRAYLLDGISCFGLTVDSERNDTLVGTEGMIHSDRSDASIAVMHNDEMGEMARIVASLPHT